MADVDADLVPDTVPMPRRVRSIVEIAQWLDSSSTPESPSLCLWDADDTLVATASGGPRKTFLEGEEVMQAVFSRIDWTKRVRHMVRVAATKKPPVLSADSDCRDGG
eukprot:Sspe_Gene.9549::Locus_3204_Transcript_3_7_Confidence_0.625_Length_525::g.9549::m.9549